MWLWLRKNYFRVGFGLFLVLYALSLPNRVLNIDDPWLAELSYWINKVGHARSTLWTGINGYEVIDVNYHKIFVLTGTLFMKFFGFSLPVFKSVGLFFLLLFFGAFWIYFRDRKKEYTTSDFWVAVFLLWSSNLVFNYSFVFRPEIAIMAIGFFGFYFFRKSLLLNDLRSMAYAGFLFGLCISFHLKGTTYLLTGGLFLLIFHRNIKSILVFGSSAVLGIIPYFWDMTSWERLETWKRQFNNNPVVVGMPKTIWHYLLKPLEEHKRFFHQDHEIAFSLLFFVCLIAFYKDLKKYLSIELRFFFLTVLVMGFTAHSMTDKSMLLYYPFMVLVMVTTLKVMPKNNVFVKVLLAVSLLVNMALNVRLIRDSVDVAARSLVAADQIGKKNVKVMADISFIFNQMDNYEIYSANNYTFICAFYTHEKPNMEMYFEYVERFGVDYIVLDTVSMSGEEEELFKNVDLSEGKFLKNFRVKYNKNGITVMEKMIPKELSSAEKS